MKLKIKSWLSFALISSSSILSLPLLATPAQASFRVCNQTGATVWVAYGRAGTIVFGSDGMGGARTPEQADGWWRIEDGGCSTVYGGDARGISYVYATDGDYQEWGEDVQLCVDPSSRFSFRGRQNTGCTAQYEERYFNSVRASSSNVTYTLE